MKQADLGTRLEALPAALSNPEFLANKGIGNEIGFYIFAYDAKDEPIVGSFVPHLIERLRGVEFGLNVIEFNLYLLILDLLEERGLLEQTFELEAKKGSAAAEKALRRIVRPENLIKLVEARLAGTAPDLVVLTGIGAAYPLVRSHTVLNNLHSVIDQAPLVMFFPGSYDGQELRLFNILKDDNYYRAFPLLETVP